MLNLKLKNNIIISAGYCDFTNELKEGETQVECVNTLIPADISTHYQYDAETQALIERETPLTEEEVNDMRLNDIDKKDIWIKRLDKIRSDYLITQYSEDTQKLMLSMLGNPFIPNESKEGVALAFNWVLLIKDHQQSLEDRLVAGETWSQILPDINFEQFTSINPHWSWRTGT